MLGFFTETMPEEAEPLQRTSLTLWLPFKNREMLGHRCIQVMKERKDLKASAPEPAIKHRKVVQHPLPEARKEKDVYLPQFVKSAQSNRCRFRGCKSHTRIKCVLGDVFFCVTGNRNCFMQYHKD